MAQTHPGRLAAVAVMFGMEPAPVGACRVLEIGCGNGGNLIPMAFYLPGSSFTGVDLAEGPIADGRRSVGELGILNLELLAMDLREIDAAMGEFDYIIAHGLYSWVPADVREGLLGVCRERLAPQGVALVSYNCLPGRHIRMMFREMMLYHTRGCSTDLERIERARELLLEIREARAYPRSWELMVEEQIEQMLNTDAGWFFHDDLAAVNEAFSVTEFVASASRHSLQYLGDADAAVLDHSGDEQHQDFLTLRQFRQTLLCHEAVALQHPAGMPREAEALPIHVSLRPRSSRLARWESARSGVVTYSSHTVLKLDVIVKELIVLMDGTRDFEQIAVDLARLREAPSTDEIRAALPGILARMAANGLLED